MGSQGGRGKGRRKREGKQEEGRKGGRGNWEGGKGKERRKREGKRGSTGIHMYIKHCKIYTYLHKPGISSY